jgi:hypothetical protein
VRPVITALVSLFIFCFVSAVPAEEISDPEQIVRQALGAHSRDTDGQVAALADLIWPEGEADPAVQAVARQHLVGFGKDAFSALRRKVSTIPMKYRADLVNVAREAYNLVIGGRPPEYLTIMYEAIWFGDRNARLAAIPEIIRFNYTRPLIPLMDAAEEDELLVPVVIEAMASLQDDRARFWLGSMVNEPGNPHQQAAAVALARIGKRALVPLRDCLTSEDRPTRENAARALAVSAGSAELTFLYDYLEGFPEDDPAVLDGLRRRAQLLERALQQLDEELSESGEPEI